MAFAKDAISQCGLDKVFFLVEPRPRRKQGVKAFEHRAEMVRLALKEEPKLGRIVLEQQRFTPIETLPVLQKRFEGAELYLLMGDDGLGHFATADWPHVEYLVENIKFAIGLREYSRQETEKRIAILQETHGWRMDHKLFRAPKADFSSSKIKQQIKKGQTPTGLAKNVLSYIRTQNLYGRSGSSSKS